MIDFSELTDIVMKLTALPFFPTDDHGRLAIVEEIGDIVHSLDEARWLVKRTLKLYPKWSSVVELRAVLSAKVMPRDGIEAVSGSFPDGIIPPERPERLQIARPMRALQPGEPVSADPELAALVAHVKSPRLTATPPRRLPQQVPRVTNDEIESIKRLQAEQALNATTRDILSMRRPVLPVPGRSLSD